MRRLLTLCLLWPALALAQDAPVVQWTHAGTNVTRFELHLAANWVVQAGLPTPTAGVYAYTLPPLPAGQYTIAVRACYGADCAPSSTVMVVKMAATGATAHNFYWVDDDGAVTTWANCKSDAPLSGASACTLATANTNAAAGQTVFFRGGTYTVSNSTAINPTNSGTGADAKIVFQAYNGESVIFAEGAATAQAINLAGDDWIKIAGFTFSNMTTQSSLSAGSQYNEIAYCRFLNTASAGYATTTRVLVIGAAGDPSTHNWFHHNVISRRHHSSPCNEGIDLLRIGMAVSGDANDYNTVEHNYLEYSGHANLVVYGHYSVVSHNIGHNEPWIEGCTVYDGTMPDNVPATRGSTATDEHTIASSGELTFNIDTGLTDARWGAGYPVVLMSSANWANVMSGHIHSYDVDTGVLVAHITKSGGSGTHSDWIVSTKNNPYYSTAAYNLKYSHRTFGVENQDNLVPTYLLIEGNRFGFAGINPNNAGADNFDIGTPRNIIRYNAAYGAMGAGFGWKHSPSYSESTANDNRFYHNTGYHNGYGYDFTLYGGLNTTYLGQGLAQSIKGAVNPLNVIKNNLMYDNALGDICVSESSYTLPCTPNETYDIIGSNLTGTDPQFVNPVLTDPTSQALFSDVHGYSATALPDLRIAAGSAARDAAGALTTATSAGDATVTLPVADALYFQDGTWGADLTRNITLFPDWVAVGTVSNVAAISSINYATNTITLATALSWSEGASVWLYKKSDGVVVLVGSAPDYGAHEYGTPTGVAPTGVSVR